MKRFIGLDVHASSTTAAVIGESGRRLTSQVLETNGAALVGFMKSQPGQVHLCLEEGIQSGWLTEILQRHVHRLVVCGLGKKKRGPKSDIRDAFSLAEDLRKGAVEVVVYKEIGAFGKLRQLNRVYQICVQDTVRAQNRIKALYRARGILVIGKTVASGSKRSELIETLPSRYWQAARLIYDQYDYAVDLGDRSRAALMEELGRHPIAKTLQTCPGLGPIRVAQILATVVSPHRFRTKRQFWSYCGMGIMMRSSSDWVQSPDGKWVSSIVNKTRGLNRNHNRALKGVFKGAATTVICQRPGGELREAYERLTAAGTKPNLAKLTLARKIAASSLAMWKREEEYKEQKPTPLK
mgnify:FL=1